MVGPVVAAREVPNEEFNYHYDNGNNHHRRTLNIIDESEKTLEHDEHVTDEYDNGDCDAHADAHAEADGAIDVPTDEEEDDGPDTSMTMTPKRATTPSSSLSNCGIGGDTAFSSSTLLFCSIEEEIKRIGVELSTQFNTLVNDTETEATSKKNDEAKLTTTTKPNRLVDFFCLIGKPEKIPSSSTTNTTVDTHAEDQHLSSFEEEQEEEEKKETEEEENMEAIEVVPSDEENDDGDDDNIDSKNSNGENEDADENDDPDQQSGNDSSNENMYVITVVSPSLSSSPSNNDGTECDPKQPSSSTTKTKAENISKNEKTRKDDDDDDDDVVVIKPSVLDRYPQQRPDMDFPEEVATFCFPTGYNPIIITEATTNSSASNAANDVATVENEDEAAAAEKDDQAEAVDSREVKKLQQQQRRQQHERRPIRRQPQIPPVNVLTFVLTSSAGNRLYAAALIMYEKDDKEEGREEASTGGNDVKKQSPSPLSASASSNSATAIRTIKYYPKCFVTISHYPYFDVFRTFLKQLYRILKSNDSSSSSSRGEAAVPLERYIASFVQDVPLPITTKNRYINNNIIHQHQMGLSRGTSPNINNATINDNINSNGICNSTTATSTSTMKTLLLADLLPLVNFSYQPLFCTLSVSNVLVVWGLLLEEGRIVLCSEHHSLLTPVAEALLSLLFPLRWQGMYIPVLPSDISADIFDAPIPFLVGTDPRKHNLLNKEEGGGGWTVPPGVVVVDLDLDEVHLGCKSEDGLTMESRMIPHLPGRESMALKVQLEELVDQLYLVPYTGVKGRIFTGIDDALVDNGVREPYSQMTRILSKEKAKYKNHREYILRQAQKLFHDDDYDYIDGDEYEEDDDDFSNNHDNGIQRQRQDEHEQVSKYTVENERNNHNSNNIIDATKTNSSNPSPVPPPSSTSSSSVLKDDDDDGRNDGIFISVPPTAMTSSSMAGKGKGDGKDNHQDEDNDTNEDGKDGSESAEPRRRLSAYQSEERQLLQMMDEVSEIDDDAESVGSSSTCSSAAAATAKAAAMVAAARAKEAARVASKVAAAAAEKVKKNSTLKRKKKAIVTSIRRTHRTWQAHTDRWLAMAGQRKYATPYSLSNSRQLSFRREWIAEHLYDLNDEDEEDDDADRSIDKSTKSIDTSMDKSSKNNDNNNDMMDEQDESIGKTTTTTATTKKKKKKRNKFTTLTVRRAFLNFLADTLLSDYKQFIHMEEEEDDDNHVTKGQDDPSNETSTTTSRSSSSRTPIIRIDKEGYLQKLSLSSRKKSFIHLFLDSQMFERFIHQAAALPTKDEYDDKNDNGTNHDIHTSDNNIHDESFMTTTTTTTTKPGIIHDRGYSTSPSASSSWAALFDRYVSERKKRHYHRSGSSSSSAAMKKSGGSNSKHKNNGTFGKINDAKKKKTCIIGTIPSIGETCATPTASKKEHTSQCNDNKKKDEHCYTIPNKLDNTQKLVSYTASRQSPSLSSTSPSSPQQYYYVCDENDNENEEVVVSTLDPDDAWTSWCSSMFCFFNDQ